MSHNKRLFIRSIHKILIEDNLITVTLKQTAKLLVTLFELPAKNRALKENLEKKLFMLEKTKLLADNIKGDSSLKKINMVR